MSSYFDSLNSGLFGSASVSAAPATADQPKSKPALSGAMVTTDGTRVVTPNLKIGQSLADIDYSQPLEEGESGVDESGRLTFTAAKADGFFNKVKNFFYSLVVDHVFGLKDIWSGIVSLCSSSTPEQKAAKEKAAKFAEEQLVKKNEINDQKKSLKELNQARKDYYDVVIFQNKHPTEDPAGTERRRQESAKKYIDQVIEHYGLDDAYDSVEERADDQDKVIRQELAIIFTDEYLGQGQGNEVVGKKDVVKLAAPEKYKGVKRLLKKKTDGSASITRTPAYKEFIELKTRLEKRLIRKSDRRAKILNRQAAKSLAANSSDAAEKLEAARKEVSSHAIVDPKEAMQNLEDLQRKKAAAAIYSAQNSGNSSESVSEEDLNRSVFARMQELSKQISTNEFQDGDLDALTLDFNTLSQEKLELEKAIAEMKETRKEVAKANRLPVIGGELAESSAQISERGRAMIRKFEESIKTAAEAFELIDGCIKEYEAQREVLNAKLQVLNLKIEAGKKELSNEASNTLATLRSLFPNAVKPARSMFNPLNWFRS